MAYASWSVVFGEQPSAAKWNILGTNDAYFNTHLPAGYTMQIVGNAGAYSDATTYYIGMSPVFDASSNPNITTTAAIKRMYVPKAGTVTKIYGFWYTEGTPPSNEQSTMSFRLNNTTDTTITSTLNLNPAASVAFSNTALSIAVVAGDYYELKWVTPTWATNPSGNTGFTFVIYIEI